MRRRRSEDRSGLRASLAAHDRAFVERYRALGSDPVTGRLRGALGKWADRAASLDAGESVVVRDWEVATRVPGLTVQGRWFRIEPDGSLTAVPPATDALPVQVEVDLPAQAVRQRLQRDLLDYTSGSTRIGKD